MHNKTALFATVNVFSSGLGNFANVATLLGSIGTMASVSGYSQELEFEADEEGLRLMTEAGYDPDEAPKVFAHLADWLRENEISEPFFFASHPRLQERIEHYGGMIAAPPYSDTQGEAGRDPYLTRIASIALLNADLNIKAGRYTIAEREIGVHMEARGESDTPHVLLGEIYRQRGAAGDPERTVAAYRRAIELNAFNAKPHKALGMLFFRQGDKAAARGHLETYLRLSPQASDRGYIEHYLKECQ